MTNNFYKEIQNEIASIKENKTYKIPRFITSSLSGSVNVEGLGDTIVLCSNNYLGLASNPQIIEESLKDKTEYFCARLKEKGFKPLESQSAIIQALIRDTAMAIKIASEMLESGVYVIGFGYPVVPEGTARIRIQASDALSYKEMDFSIDVFLRVCGKYL